MRRELKKMEKRMDREDERELKQLEGRPKRHILRNVLLIALGTIAAALVAGYFLFDVPSWQRLDIQKITAVQQTGAIYDRNGELVSALKGSEDRTLIALSSLPDHVKNAFIAAEDLRFYRHPGFDVVRIFGAVMANLRSRGFSEGASTITQQLVKLSHLSSEKTQIGGSLPGAAIGSHVQQGRNFANVPELRLLRPRRVWRGGRRAGVF